MVIILGTNSLAKLALEIFQQNGLVVYGLLTEEALVQKAAISHVPILGSIDDEQYLALLGKSCEAFVALEQTTSRQKLISNLHEQRQVMPINAIHGLANLALSTVIGHGNLIDMSASLGPNVHLGNHCIIHQHAAIEQEAVIKDFVQVGTGSIIGAQTLLEEHVFIGTGAILVAGLRIGAGARIGAGSVVLDHVSPGETLLGNPAKPIKT